jgi:urease accessory protein
MNRKVSTLTGALVALLAAPTLAFAHAGVGETTGFMHGFGHPISGLDHILAMVMVGVLHCNLVAEPCGSFRQHSFL